MKILTPNAKYALEINDNIPDEKDRLDSQQVVKEAWIENVYQIHESDLNDTGIMIDIGANIGAVSLYVASLNDSRDQAKVPIHVIAYEPEPHNLEVLAANVGNNGKTEQIEIVDQAVSNFKGNIEITNRGGNSTIGVNLEDSSVVEVVTLEDIFLDNGIVQCDVMKIDVEGAEYDMLLGASLDTLRRIKYLTLEFSATDLKTFGKTVAHLAQVFGIQIIGVPERGGYIYARRY